MRAYTSREIAMTAVGGLFIIVSNRNGPACPYYATENGFEIYNPFREEPFHQVMLSFDSETQAKQFIRDHCKNEMCAHPKLASPETQDHIESFNPDRQEQLRRFLAAEQKRRSLVGSGKDSSAGHHSI